MNSNYNGKYYPYNYKRSLENHIYINNKKRPYYIWIIGDNKNVSHFLEKVKIENLKGFENSYFLSNPTKNKHPFYTVLLRTNKVGKWKPIKKTKIIKGIKDIKYENKKIQFSIGIDLSNISVNESYKTDHTNYTVTDGFTIKSIDKVGISNMKKNDFVSISKTSATHFITIELNQDYAIQNLQLELVNKIPLWVSKSNSIDDRDITNQLDKTFGLLYLIQGVSEAYDIKNPDNKSYFKIDITIN